MKIEVIDERSVAVDLLRSGGVVLDAGARGYVFAREMKRRGMRVVCVDPEPPPADLAIDGVLYPRVSGHSACEFGPEHVVAGLVGVGCTSVGRASFASWDNGEGDCLVGWGGPVPERATVHDVDTLDVLRLMEECGPLREPVRHWSCVKMNIEGAEFDVLRTWPGPIADQITVSFHDHTGANPRGQATYDEILAHIGQWYDVVRHVREERYSAGASYWDSLFVLRGAA